jgi:CHAT domain-containing protein/tetratricopeptide (TPR) repeat protein
MRREGDHADNIEQAIQYYEHALTVHTRDAFPAYWALTHNALGTAWLERRKGNLDDNADAAARIFEAALTVLDLDRDPFHWGECYNGLGAANLRLVGRHGRPALDRAIDCFERATTAHTRERFRSRWSQLLNNLAKAYLDRNDPGDPERALDLLRRSIDATDRGAESYLWATFKKNEAAAHSQISGDESHAHADAAVAALREALSVFDAERYPAEHRDTQAALGQMWFRRSEWGDALAAYREAIRAAVRVFDRAYTETGRLTEAEELSAIYRDAAFCLVQLGQAHEALELYDRGKTRVLTDAIELSHTKFEGLPPAQREEAAKARDAIAAAESQMRLSQVMPGRPSDADLGRAIAQARERLSQAIGKSAQPRETLADLLRVIPDEGALVVPMLTSRGGVAFVVPHGVNTVTNRHVVSVSIDFDGANALFIGSEERPGLLRTYVEYLNERGEGRREERRRAFNRYQRKMQEVCGQLWPALMQPIVERLESLDLRPRAPVLIVPHGALALMPLHAASVGRGHSVLQRFDVKYSPSLAVQAQTQARVAAPREKAQLLAIADPRGDLEFADVECGELARLVGADRATVLGGASATHDAVVAAVSSPTYLHFSCHGFYDWRDPLRSGLVLADGVLDVAEIMSPRIDLDATRVVVLSACETGLFDFNRHPDEFVGLNSGLLMAGAPAVASTLWAVEDRSTALLMSEFYRRLLDGDSISFALGEAQLWLSTLTFSNLRAWVLEHASLYAEEAKRRPMFEPIARAVSKWAAELATMNDIDGDARPYDHPYYWAAFMALGAA